MFIDERRAFTYFRNRFIIRKTAQNWYAFDNPFDPEGDGKRKMAVHFDIGIVKCWRTGWRGYIVDFVMQYENLDYYEAKTILRSEEPTELDQGSFKSVQLVDTVKIDLPFGFKPISDGSNALGVRGQNYLLDRGFDLEVLDKQGFGYCAEKHEQDEENFFGYIIVPFARSGKFQYFLGRDFIGNFLRYKNPNKAKYGVGKADLLFNEDALEMQNDVFVTEGWSDAATMGEEGVASLGWSLSAAQKTKIFNGSMENLVFIPDLGEHQQVSYYNLAVREAMNFMVKFNVFVLDLSEFKNLGKDVNEIGKDNVKYLYKNTEKLSLKKAMQIIM